MQEREANIAFERGRITAAMLERDEDRAGWVILLRSVSGDAIPLENKRGRSIRLFKTSDAALRWCQRTGFQEVRVNL